jgi:hypothetical protein
MPLFTDCIIGNLVQRIILNYMFSISRWFIHQSFYNNMSVLRKESVFNIIIRFRKAYAW